MSICDHLREAGGALIAAADNGFEDPDDDLDEDDEDFDDEDDDEDWEDDLGGGPGEECSGWGDLEEPRDPPSDDPDDDDGHDPGW